MAEVVGIKGIATYELAGIPVGGVGVGLLASGFVDGIMGLLEGMTGRKLPVWAAKGLGAYAAGRWLPRYIGADGAKFATAILAVDAVQSLYDFRALTSGLFKKVAIMGTGGAVGTASVGQYIPEVTRPPELISFEAVGEVGEVGQREEEVLVSVT